MTGVQTCALPILVLGHGSKLYDGDLAELLSRFDRTRTVTVRYDREPEISGLPGCVDISKQGELLHLTYSPETLPTPELLSMLQQAGTIREMTVQPQNIDHLIAAMYRELGL